MKKKIIIGICILLIAVLLIPIPLRLKEDGTDKYQAVLYSASNVYSLNSAENDVSLETGIIVKIFGIEVVNNVATATEKLSSGGVFADDAFEIAVSYANWAEMPMAAFGVLNTNKLAISSVHHLPIYRFDTLKDLEQFKLFEEYFTSDSGYNEIPSF